jgi:hypothetical protein
MTYVSAYVIILLTQTSSLQQVHVIEIGLSFSGLYKGLFIYIEIIVAAFQLLGIETFEKLSLK